MLELAVDLIRFWSKGEVFVKKHRVLIIFGEEILKLNHLFGITCKCWSINGLVFDFLGVVDTISTLCPKIGTMVLLNECFHSLRKIWRVASSELWRDHDLVKCSFNIKYL